MISAPSASPEIIRRVLVLICFEVLAVESLLVHLKLLLALLSCNTLCLLKVHRDCACGLGAHRPVSRSKHMLLHLVSIDALSNGSVTLSIIAIEARLYLAFFLLARSAAKCITKDVLTLD